MTIIRSRQKPTQRDKFISYFNKGHWFTTKEVSQALGISQGRASVVTRSFKDNLILSEYPLATAKYKWTEDKNESLKSWEPKQLDIESLRKEYLEGKKSIRQISTKFRVNVKKVTEICKDIKHLRKPIKSQFNTPSHLKKYKDL